MLLAIVFVFSFVLLGVGSGSNGISDALQSFFGQNSGTLAQLADQGQAAGGRRASRRTSTSTSTSPASTRATTRRRRRSPRCARRARSRRRTSTSSTGSRAIYGGQAGREGDNYRNVLAAYSENVTTPPGLDTSSQIGQALTSDPYSQALQTQLNDAYTKVTTAYQKVAGVYKQAAQICEGDLGRAERAAAVGLGRPERERRRHRDHRLPALPQGGARQPERRCGPADARAAPGVAGQPQG